MREKFFSEVRACRPFTSLACVLSACNDSSPSASNRRSSDVERRTFATLVVIQTDHLLEVASLRCMQKAISASCYRVGACRAKLTDLCGIPTTNDYTTLLLLLLCISKSLLLTTRVAPVQLVLRMTLAGVARTPFKATPASHLYSSKAMDNTAVCRQYLPSRTRLEAGGKLEPT